jgi:predicted dithiol-disulfide oxidoreductase (DUF899 family)
MPWLAVEKKYEFDGAEGGLTDQPLEMILEIMLHPAKLRGCIEGVAGRDDRSAARELAMVARKDRRPQSRTTRASKKLIGFRPGRDFLLRLA